MTGSTHVLLGASAAFLLAEATSGNLADHAALVGAAVATSKLPDVDLRLPMRHRGPTHTLLACATLVAAAMVAASLIAPPLASTVAAGVLVGYGGHLLADACTPHGAPLLAPFRPRCIHLLPYAQRIRTGGGAETLLGLVVIGLLAWYAIGVYG